MHIAVCMDVAADRKQLERLLGRSADARFAKDNSIPFYIQSYGNKSALLQRPAMYDLFFINILNDNMDSVQLIRKLRELEVNATIVYCPGEKDNLSHLLQDEDRVLILNQPILVKDLEAVMDCAVLEMKARVPKLSIHGAHGTIQIEKDEFIYAQKDRDQTILYLSGNREITIAETVKSLYFRSASFETIKPISEKLIVNIDYLESTGFTSVILKDGTKLPGMHKYIKLLNK